MSGFVRLQLRRGPKRTAEKVYVVKNLRTPLLRRPVIVALGLLVRVDSIEMEIIKACYPKLCSGLGEIQQTYAIKLKPGAVPFSVKTPSRIPTPLVGKGVAWWSCPRRMRSLCVCVWI